MNLKMFYELVSAGKNPGLLKYLYRIKDPEVLEKKYKLLRRLPDVPEKLVEAFRKDVKKEIKKWEITLTGSPETHAGISEMSDGRIELSPESFKKYYDELLNGDSEPVLTVQVKDCKKESYEEMDICSREEDIRRRRESVILTKTDVVDYELIALAGYMRIRTDMDIELPKAIALGTAAGVVINYISGFINKSMEKEFVEFF